MVCFQLQLLDSGNLLVCSPRVVYVEQPESWLPLSAVADTGSSALPLVVSDPVVETTTERSPSASTLFFSQQEGKKQRRSLPPLQCEILSVCHHDQDDGSLESAKKGKGMTRQGQDTTQESLGEHSSTTKSEVLWLYRKTSVPPRGLVLVGMQFV